MKRSKQQKLIILVGTAIIIVVAVVSVVLILTGGSFSQPLRGAVALYPTRYPYTSAPPTTTDDVPCASPSATAAPDHGACYTSTPGGRRPVCADSTAEICSGPTFVFVPGQTCAF